MSGDGHLAVNAELPHTVLASRAEGFPCLCTANVVPYHMGFSEAKRAVVAALREGNFEHEAREALAEKNLLAVGDVDAELR